MLILLLLGLLHVVSAFTVCFYEKTEGYALYGHNTFVLKMVSLDECRGNCTEKGDQCLSFDYNYDTDSCFMSDQTKNTDPVNFGKHAQLDYFEKVCPAPHTESPSTHCEGVTCKYDFTCILADQWCNGDYNCPDRSDEMDCAGKCTAYACPSGTCISTSWLCDGFNDCGEWRDESTCTKETCRGQVCPTGRCVHWQYLCNGRDDCGDGSDEADCFRCTDGSFIRQDQLCDGITQCGDWTDESSCTEETCRGQLCATGTRCISENYLCNRLHECEDGSDEDHCFKCNDGIIAITYEQVCNGEEDCKNGEDEEKCKSI